MESEASLFIHTAKNWFSEDNYNLLSGARITITMETLFFSFLQPTFQHFLISPATFSSVLICLTHVVHRPAFEDEITRNLKHTGAGILSMANRSTCSIELILANVISSH